MVILGIILIVLVIFARLYNPAETLIKYLKKKTSRRGKRGREGKKYGRVKDKDVQNTIGLSRNARRYRPQPPSEPYPEVRNSLNNKLTGKERAKEKERNRFNRELVGKNEDFRGLEFKEDDDSSEGDGEYRYP